MTINSAYRSTRHGGRRQRTDLLVWHSTAGGTAVSSLQWIARAESVAGYHFVIERDGTVYSSTPLDHIAWHAGVSAWPVPASGVPKGASVNGRSIGVSFANKNDGSEPVTPAQVAAALTLARSLASQYPALKAVDAHIRHRDCAPGRKSDPLESALNWPTFRAQLREALA